jgi:hypothetical protein
MINDAIIPLMSILKKSKKTASQECSHNPKQQDSQCPVATPLHDQRSKPTSYHTYQ